MVDLDLCLMNKNNNESRVTTIHSVSHTKCWKLVGDLNKAGDGGGEESAEHLVAARR